ncbi:hypothetical protein M413DRAFT_444666 [Hebeloma cylindrosporum]|uniref:Uncharacterized protein n=1 Tax=Hebeloma cylindrosporum TaxID=76867 RepID=A0A0C2XX46_HEBCY|nr:hypothetical protein M413DRAFT_444666 [Hebeloma cylindrosporum h7]
MPVHQDRPRRMSFPGSQPQHRSPPPHQVPSLPPKPQALPSRPITEPEKPQRRMDRKSRFDQSVVSPQDRDRMPDGGNNPSDRERPSDRTQRHASPPLSREPSMMSSSARHSDRGHSPDGRSDNSRNGGRGRDGIVPAATAASQETGSFNPEVLMNPASLRRVGSRLGEYDQPRYASTLGPYQYFMDDEPQPNLSRRLSLEKPLGQRNYGQDDGERTSPVGQIQPSPQSLGGRELQEDKLVSLKDRVERAPHPAQRQGAPISLLERLSSAEDVGQASTGSEQSLRDRLVPSKRDRDDMMRDDGDGREPSYDGEDGYDSKRAKRRSGKGRRGGRR